MEKINGSESALTNNHYIISQVDEVATEDIGQPDCKLTKPYIVNTESGKTILEPFMMDLTRDDIFMMGSDKILTLADSNTYTIRTISKFD